LKWEREGSKGGYYGEDKDEDEAAQEKGYGDGWRISLVESDELSSVFVWG